MDRIYHSPFYAIYLWDGPVPYWHYCSVYISSVYSVILACYTKMLHYDPTITYANTSIGVLGVEHGSFVRRRTKPPIYRLLCICSAIVPSQVFAGVCASGNLKSPHFFCKRLVRVWHVVSAIIPGYHVVGFHLSGLR